MFFQRWRGPRLLFVVLRGTGLAGGGTLCELDKVCLLTNRSNKFALSGRLIFRDLFWQPVGTLK